MRIALINSNFSTLSQTFVYERVRTLVEHGHRVRVLAFRRSLEQERPFDDVVVLRKSKDFWSRISPVRLTNWARARLQQSSDTSVQQKPYGSKRDKSLFSELERFAPDIVQAEFGPMGVLAAPIARQLGLPLAVFMHGYDVSRLPLDPDWRRAYELMWPDVALVMVPSEFMRQKVVALGARADRVVIQRNGIDLRKWQYSNPAARFDGKRVTFIFVGRLVEKKGPIQLVQAFARCRQLLGDNIQTQLVICGDGVLLPALLAEIDRLGIVPFVDVAGPCTHEDVCVRMQQAHIMLQHSVTANDGDTEGLPVCLTEAAACGLPMIATCHSGIPEIVRDGPTGYLVGENDIEAMAVRMAQLAQRPAEWMRMGRAARDLVETEFAQERTIDSYVGHLSRLAFSAGAQKAAAL